VAILLLVLAGAVLWQCHLVRGAFSATWDEVVYARLALATFTHGTFAVFEQLGTAPLPVLLGYLPLAGSGVRLPVPPEAIPELVEAARTAHALLIGVPLVWAVTLWLVRRRGLAAGAVGGALAAFSPTILAHASLATTDACLALFSLVALAAMVRHSRRPSRLTLLGVGLAMGLGFASKHSAVFLVPVLLAELVWVERRGRPLSAALAAALWQTAAATLIAFAVSAAFHGFSPSAPIQGLLFQAEHGRHGHETYLMGRRAMHTWWYYFPLAFVFKSTPVELILAGAAVAAGAAALRSRGSSADPAPRLWALAGFVYAILMVLSPIGIGQRYLLVLYPLILLLAVDWGASLACRPGSLRRAAALGALAVLIQAAGAAAVSPQYLAYFSPLVGGPAQGYRYLVDSNLDWGQDLPALRTRLADLGGGCVALAYFGSASPRAYGVEDVAWDEEPPAQGARCEWLAVSATFLQGLYLPGDPFAALRALSPTARAGYSIFLYSLKDPAVRNALAEAQRITHRAQGTGG
jgi:hypothetical protein